MYKILDIFYENISFRVTNDNMSYDKCNNELNNDGSSDFVSFSFEISTQNQKLFFLYDCQRQAGPLPRSWAPVSCADDSANNSFTWLGGRYNGTLDASLMPQSGNCTVSEMPVMGYEGVMGADYQ
jgi:hypothetical protein